MKIVNVKLIWEDGVWYSKAVGDEFGLTLESGSFDALVERVKIAVPEMVELSSGYKGEIQLAIEAERVDSLKVKIA